MGWGEEEGAASVGWGTEGRLKQDKYHHHPCLWPGPFPKVGRVKKWTVARPNLPLRTPQEMLTPLLTVESRCLRGPTWESRLAPEEHLARATACDSFSRCRTMASQPSHSAMVCS